MGAGTRWLKTEIFSNNKIGRIGSVATLEDSPTMYLRKVY